MYGGVTSSEFGIPLREYFLGKHTSGIDPGERMSAAMDQFREDAKDFPKILKRLHHQPVGKGAFDLLLLRVARAKMMPWSRLRIIDETFQSGKSHSAWDFLEAFATAAARNPPLAQMGQVHSCYKMLEDWSPIPGNGQ
jgi:hypothetical protein